MAFIFGSGYEYVSASTFYEIIVPLMDDKFVVVYRDTDGPDYIRARVGTISGTTISYGDVSEVYTGIGVYIDAVSLTDDKIVVAYRDQSSNNTGEIKIGDISGTIINFGSGHEYTSPHQAHNNTLCRLTDSKFVICWEVYDAGLGYGDYSRARVGNVSGTTVSYGDAVNFTSDDVHGFSIITIDEETCIISYIISSTNDGKCTVATISGTDISYGPKYEYHNNCDTGFVNAHIHNLVHIGNSGFVVGYRDITDNHGEAKVGSISGTTIDFGSGYQYTSGSMEYPLFIAYSGILNKVIAIYKDPNNSNYGTVQFGTIDGDQITWSDETVFYSANVAHMIKPSFINFNKFVIAFRDLSDSNYGKAVVGQITLFEINKNNVLIIPAHQLIATSWYPDTWGNRIR